MGNANGSNADDEEEQNGKLLTNLFSKASNAIAGLAGKKNEKEEEEDGDVKEEEVRRKEDKRRKGKRGKAKSHLGAENFVIGKRQRRR